MIPCNVSPASEEIADFIVRYSPRAVDSLYELARTRCVNLVSQEYAIVHAPLSGVLPLSFTQHTYSAIPKLTDYRIPRPWKPPESFRSFPSQIS